MNRRTFLGACATALASTAGCLTAAESGPPTDTTMAPLPEGPTVGLEPVLTGSTSDGGTGPRFPVDLDVADGGDVWYVVDRPGVVWAYSDGEGDPRPALDLTERVPTDGEQGLFSVALHPDFERNRRLYVRYSAPRRPDTPDGYSHVGVVSEFRATEGGTRVRPDTERTVLAVAEPGQRHNGGALAFGPDGSLYASYGEGQWLGGEGENRQAEDWYDWNPGGNAQDVEANLLGSILRIDVDGREDGKPYGIPDDNPLVGDDGLDEHYAWGFRNPWRMGFSAGELYVADVGEILFEEVDRVVAGGNYGWNVREGRSCFNAHQYPNPGPWCPSETPDGDPLRDPVVQYAHSVETDSGTRKRYSAVVGGYVYGNDAVPSLSGEYVFGDFSGHLLAATPGGDRWPMRRLRVAGGLRSVPLAFARDPDGELLVLSAGSTGRVDRIVPSDAEGAR